MRLIHTTSQLNLLLFLPKQDHLEKAKGILVTYQHKIQRGQQRNQHLEKHVSSVSLLPLLGEHNHCCMQVDRNMFVLLESLLHNQNVLTILKCLDLLWDETYHKHK